jgi:predicted nuclease of predicted toxin-antitoxin system
MPHAIYMDAHVPSAITEGLRRCGVEVMTCQEDGSDKLPDDKLLERATQLGRVLFSQDDDLLKLAAKWQATGKEFHGVI